MSDLKKKSDLFVKDLKVGDKVQTTNSMGRVGDGENGVVIAKAGFQVIVKFASGIELKLGDNGTRWLKKALSRETGICRNLAMELAKKYPAGSSIPGREIDKKIVDAPPLDMRSAWEEISGILQNMGRKIGKKTADNVHILEYSIDFHAKEVAKGLVYLNTKGKFPGKQLTNQQLGDVIVKYLVGKGFNLSWINETTPKFINSLKSLIVRNLKNEGWKIN